MIVEMQARAASGMNGAVFMLTMILSEDVLHKKNSAAVQPEVMAPSCAS